MNRTLRMTGPLNFDTVPAVYMNTVKQFETGSAMEIDCSGVTACNSAALALLLECMMEAERKNAKIRFTGIPDQLMKMAATCGIRKLFEDYQ